MAFEQKELTGSLFINDKKDPTNPTHSDYNGSVKVGGVEYWLNGWKKSKEGKTWLGLSLKAKTPSVSTSQPTTSNNKLDF